ncbi:MAG: alanine racemase [Pseudomonadota bacterium]|nr:alanine racemase [Pseudomonadota bacterium]
MRRDAISTPALVLDLDAMQHNIAVMTTHAKRAGVALRPHAKAHKCTVIASKLAEAGALGPACATLDEAEAMAGAGLSGILITSPVVSAAMLDRLRKLLMRGGDVHLVVDAAANVARLSDVAAAAEHNLRLIVELDVGQKRTGCREPEDAVALAHMIAGAAWLRFAGIQAYWGHLQQVMPIHERRGRAEIQARQVRRLVELLRKSGLAPGIITGGGTGTSFIDPPFEIFTEIQPGSFLFLDSCYAAIPMEEGAANPFRPSLFVAATVVASNHPDRVIINAGYKALATDSGQPLPMSGAPANATYRFMGDEHGAIDFTSGPAPVIGDMVELLTPHCDPTVNLHAQYHVARGEEIIDVWPIAARGY